MNLFRNIAAAVLIALFSASAIAAEPDVCAPFKVGVVDHLVV